MSPWANLNTRGKLLAVCCIVNVVCAIMLAKMGSYTSVMSVTVAAFCGLSTYRKRNQHQDARDINHEREKN